MSIKSWLNDARMKKSLKAINSRLNEDLSFIKTLYGLDNYALVPEYVQSYLDGKFTRHQFSHKLQIAENAPKGLQLLYNSQLLSPLTRVEEVLNHFGESNRIPAIRAYYQFFEEIEHKIHHLKKVARKMKAYFEHMDNPGLKQESIEYGNIINDLIQKRDKHLKKYR